MKHLFITFTLVSSFFVSAQEAPDPIRAEYFTCSFNAGKDMDDMMKWVEKWNRWMDVTDETPPVHANLMVGELPILVLFPAVVDDTEKPAPIFYSGMGKIQQMMKWSPYI